MVIKRILSVFLVLAVLVSLAVPAFAWGNTRTERYSVLPIDSVISGANLSDSFPGNSMALGQFTVDGSFFGFYSTLTSQTNILDTEIYGPSQNTVLTLSSAGHIVDVNLLDGAVITAGISDTYSLRAVITCTILTYREAAGSWVLTPITFQTSYNGETLRFGQILADSIRSRVSERYVYITSLSIQLTVYADEFDGDFHLKMPTSAAPVSAQTWSGQFNLTSETVVVVDPADPNDASFVEWLVVAVGGFLDFEIWPGMSLNQLIEFVLVFGLVFWLFTLLI